MGKVRFEQVWSISEISLNSVVWGKVSCVVSKIKSKSLCQIMLVVLIFEKNFILFWKSLDAEAALLLSQRLSLIIFYCFRCFCDSYECNFIWKDFAWNKHFIISKISSVALKMYLLKNIRIWFNKSLLAFWPYWCFVLVCWQSYPHKIVSWLGSGVVN